MYIFGYCAIDIYLMNIYFMAAKVSLLEQMMAHLHGGTPSEQRFAQPH